MSGEQCIYLLLSHSCARPQRCDDCHSGDSKSKCWAYTETSYEIYPTQLKIGGDLLYTICIYGIKFITIAYGFTAKTLCSAYKQFIRKLCNFYRLE